MKHACIALFLLSLITTMLISCGKQDERDIIDNELAYQLRHRYGQDDPASFVRIYPFKSARFSFNASGMGTPDRQIVIHIDEYGHFESQQSIVKDSGNIYNWAIIRGMDLWHLDPDTETATLAVLDQRVASGFDMDALTRIHGSKEQAEQFLKQQDIRFLPDETIGEYSCRIILQQMGQYSLKRWIYQGIDLQMGILLPPNNDLIITRELVSAVFDIPVDGDLFDIPDTFSIVSTVTIE
jgi:hypothetical protein